MDSTHEQAEAAIESLGGLDAALQDGGTAQVDLNAEVGTPETPAEQPYWTQQQRDDFGRWQQAQGAPEAPNVPSPDTSFMGEKFDPNSLSPELQQRYREMQADYTRKTQELSQLRQTYDPLTQLGDPTEIAQAVELRNMLQDPRNWVELHRDLTENLRQMGYSPQEAHNIANDAMEESAREPAAVDLSILDNDPELAPLKQYVEGLRTDVQSIKGEFDTWKADQEAQQMEMAIVGEIQRSVNAIRQARPDYGDGDIDAIFELASYHDGDMFAAAQRYDQIFADRMNRWMASKQAPIQESGAIGGGGTISSPDSGPKTWEDAKRQALEFAAQLDANG